MLTLLSVQHVLLSGFQTRPSSSSWCFASCAFKCWDVHCFFFGVLHSRHERDASRIYAENSFLSWPGLLTGGSYVLGIPVCSRASIAKLNSPLPCKLRGFKSPPLPRPQPHSTLHGRVARLNAGTFSASSLEFCIPGTSETHHAFVQKIHFFLGPACSQELFKTFRLFRFL